MSSALQRRQVWLSPRGWRRGQAAVTVVSVPCPDGWGRQPVSTRSWRVPGQDRRVSRQCSECCPLLLKELRAVLQMWLPRCAARAARPTLSLWPLSSVLMPLRKGLLGRPKSCDSEYTLGTSYQQFKRILTFSEAKLGHWPDSVRALVTSTGVRGPWGIVFTMRTVPANRRADR